MFKYLIQDENFIFSKENFIMESENIDSTIKHLAKISNDIQNLDSRYNPYDPIKNYLFALIYKIENLFLKNPDLYNIGIFAFEESVANSKETKEIYVLKDYSMNTAEAIRILSNSENSTEFKTEETLRLLKAEKKLNLDYDFLQCSDEITHSSSLKIRQPEGLKKLLRVLTEETFLKGSNFLTKEKRIEVYKNIVGHFMPEECFNYEKLFQESAITLEIRNKEYSNMNELSGMHFCCYMASVHGDFGLGENIPDHLMFVYLNLIFLQFKHKMGFSKFVQLTDEEGTSYIFCINKDKQVDASEYYYCKNLVCQFNQKLNFHFDSNFNSNLERKELSLLDVMKLCMGPVSEKAKHAFEELFIYLERHSLNNDMDKERKELSKKISQRI